MAHNFDLDENLKLRPLHKLGTLELTDFPNVPANAVGVTFELVGDAANPLFQLISRSAIAEFQSEPRKRETADLFYTGSGEDFESFAQGAASYTLSIRVTWTDTPAVIDPVTRAVTTPEVRTAGITHEITVSITDVDEAPAYFGALDRHGTPAPDNVLTTIRAISDTGITITRNGLGIGNFGFHDDDALGINSFTLSGENANLFEIRDGSADDFKFIAIRGGATLAADTAYSFTITSTATGGGDFDPVTHTVYVYHRDDAAPTAMTLSETSATADEGVTTARKLADITLTDDQYGRNTISVPTDSIFEIRDGANRLARELWLKAGVELDADTTATHTVTLALTATGAAPATPRAPATFTLTVNAEDEAPVFAALPDDLTIDERVNGETTPMNVGSPLTVTDPEGQALDLSVVGRSDFDIDPATGQIQYIGSGLDFETEPTVTFTVVAEDPGGQTTEQEVTIDVGDVREVPTAMYLTATTAVRTDANVVNRVLLAEIYFDDDARDVRSNTVTLSGDSANLFEVLANTKLYLKAGAELTTGQSYTVTLTTSALGVGDLPPPQTFTIHVLDRITSEGIQTLTLAENANGATTPVPIGTFDRAFSTGFQPGSFTTSHLFLDTGTTSFGDFRIDANSGAITYVGSGVDYETDSNLYILQVQQTVVSGSVTRTYGREVRITITDINEAPEFSAETYAFDFAENQDGSTTPVPVGTITAPDPDRNDVVAYTLTSPPAGWAIDGATGQISYTGTALDYEALTAPAARTITLTVVATDNDGTPLTDTATVTITITNVDEPPVFDAAAPTGLSLAETAGAQNVGSPVTATDPEGAGVTYALRNAPAGFSIGETSGQIAYSGTGLDFETSQTVTLVVVATGGAAEATQTISIAVTAVDEPPVFDAASYAFNLAEEADGSTPIPVGTVSATDPDGDTPVTYAVSGHPDFTINSATGAISYTGSGIDYDALTEAARTITLMVTATANSLPSTPQAVTITITNIVDAPPEFTSVPSGLSLAENVAAGNVGTAVTATDPENVGTPTYSLSGHASFSIDETSGQISYSGTGLNYEISQTVVLTVTATVGTGDSARAASQQISIAITNVVEPITFDDGPYSFTIFENSPGTTEEPLDIGTPVIAIDGEGGTPTYTITGHNNFGIDETSGQIHYIGAGVNFEVPTAQRTFNLVVTATVGTRTQTQAVTVTIHNVIEGPEFDADGTYAFDLAENQAGDRNAITIGTVTATDPEEANRDVTYSLATGRSGPAADFEIDANGVITYTGAALNLEALESTTIELVVTATTGTTPATRRATEQTVVITITDENEGPPVFGTAPTLTIAEERDGSGEGNAIALGSVTATDPDTNQEIVYSLDPARTGNALEFEIDSATGEISYIGSGLDYETPADRSTTLTVTATSGGQTATQDVTITVTAVDEAPVFTNDPITYTVDENFIAFPSFLRIGTVTATEPEGQRVSFTTPIGTRTIFVHDGNGAVNYRTETGLDFETTPIFTVTITAGSGHSPELKAFQTVTVIVRDVDEAPTAMVLSAATASVDEGTTVAQKLADITFTDDALGTNTVSISDTTRFEIRDTATANRLVKELWLKAGVTLDYETDTSHAVTITSTASGTGSGPAAVTFTLNVGNVDESAINVAPVLNDITVYTTLADTAAADDFADLTGTFGATDANPSDTSFTFAVANAVADTSETGFTHRVAGDYGTLYYNSGTGAYKYEVNNAAIDALRTGASDSDTFSVTAADDDGLASAAKTLTFNVSGANDTPVFTTPIPTDLAIPENHQTGSPTAFNVGSPVVATDADGTVGYTLRDAPAGWGIRNTGQIFYTGATFDYETLTQAQQTITFTIIARHNADTTAEQEVTIRITDVDEKPTAMTLSATTATVNEGTQAGQKLADISFTDDALGTNGVTIPTSTIFEIRNGNELWLTAGAVLDHGTSATHTITITPDVTGTGDDPAAATFTLTVTDATVLNDIDPHTLTDTRETDAFADLTGTFTAEGGANITFAVAGAVADTGETGFTHRVDGTYGTLYYNSGTGAYKYEVNNAAVNAVAAGANEADSFSVTATDSDGLASAAKTLTINVAGADEAPIFGASSYTFTVVENTLVRDIGTPVTATDSDTTDPVTYSVSGNNDFAINADGQIRYTGTTGLDYETIQTVTLTVTATAGGLSTDQQVTITVTNVESEPFAFTAVPTNLIIDENTPGPVTLGSFVARDPDVSATPSYAFGSGVDSMGFEIAGGVLRYTGTGLDHETTATIEHTVFATLLINGQQETISTTVTITVRDVDEKPTAMVLSATTATVDEGTQAGQKLADITFTDDDIGTNEATHPDSTIFEVRDTANRLVKELWIKAGVVLDHGTSATHTITITPDVTGTGGADPAAVTFTLTVADATVLNDIPAHTLTDTSAMDTFADITGTFTAEGDDDITFSVSEAVADAVDGFTHAVDGDYGTLRYNSGTGAYKYEVDDNEINGLAAGASGADSFSVTATDNDGRASTAKTLTINVAGADEAPIFGATSYAFTVAENTPADDIGTPVTATDSDTTGAVTYRISGGGGAFAISAAGQISYTGAGLDHETTPTITLTVTATSGGLSTEQQVTITVTNVDEVPEFTSVPTTGLTIAENVAGPVSFGSVTAMDPENPSATIDYSFDPNSPPPAGFAIDNNGAISYTGSGLDYETTPTIELVILATVGTGQNAQVGRQTLTITVTDVGGPTLTDIAPHTITDTAAVRDDFADLDISGTFAATGDSITYSVTLPDSNRLAVIDASETGFTHRVDGSYGALYYNSGTGAYQYIADARTIDKAGSADVDRFSVTANDGPERSTAKILTINIAGVDDTGGTNDAPVLGNIAARTITDTEAVDASFADLTGTFTATDVDGGGSIRYAVEGARGTTETGYTRSVQGTYGTLHYNHETGAYKYVADATAINGIGSPDADHFWVQASAGDLSAGKFLIINIVGADDAANDAPVMADLAYTLTDTTAADSFADIDGAFIVTDVDSSTFTFAVTGATTTTRTGYTHQAAGTYGTLYYNDGTGAYKYVANNAAINALNDRDSESDEFSITANDGTATSTAKTLTINVRGANDNPTFDATVAIEVAGGATQSLTHSVLAPLINYADPEGELLLRFRFTDGLETIYALEGGHFEYFTRPTRFARTKEWIQISEENRDTISSIQSLSLTNLRFVADMTGASAEVRIGVQTSDSSEYLPLVITFTKPDVNDAPVVTNNALAYNQGEQAIIIGATDLLSTDADADDTPDQLTYRITGTLPSAGKLQLLGDHDSDADTAETWADITATFNSFTQADINAGKLRYVPTDPEASTGASFAFTVADGGEDGAGTVSGTLNIAVRATYTVTNPAGDNVVDLSAETAPQIVDAGDGLDTIRTGQGNDQIISGLGSDLIELGGGSGQTGGADEFVYTFSGGNIWSAQDGGDRVTGFKRGEDKIVFRAVDTDVTATTLNEFLIATRGVDGTVLTRDDQMVASPLFVYENSEFFVTGVAFYFRSGGSYSDGKLAMGVLDIEFDASISWDAFLALIEIENQDGTTDANIDYGLLVIEDITVLPRLLGEGSLEFEVIQTVGLPVFNTVPTDLTIAENAPGTPTAVTIGSPVTATDTTDTITYLVSGPAGFEINSAGQIRYEGSGLNYEALTQDEQQNGIELVVIARTDGSPDVRQTVRITVTDENDAPTVANAIADQTFTFGGTTAYTIPANSFNDEDGDTLTYTAVQGDDSALPGWLVFDATAGAFSLSTTQTARTGDHDIKVTATDPDGEAISDTFTLTVQATAPDTGAYYWRWVAATPGDADSSAGFQRHNVADNTLAPTSNIGGADSDLIWLDDALPQSIATNNRITVAGGNDIYLIKSGLDQDITIRDTSLMTINEGIFNLIKFDTGVTITGHTVAPGTLPNTPASQMTVDVNTDSDPAADATITIRTPEDDFMYQVGSGTIMDYTSFIAYLDAL